MNERRPAQRSWLEVQWRKLRNPPPPVFRAVLANMIVAAIGGAVIFFLSRTNPAADITPLVAVYIATVIAAGSAATYLWVELPTGASGVRRRSIWAGLLGLFASVPIAYLALVLIFQVLPGAN